MGLRIRTNTCSVHNRVSNFDPVRVRGGVIELYIIWREQYR